MIDYHNFSGKKYINNLVQNHILNNIYFQQPVLQNQHQTLIIEEFEPDVFRQLIEYIHTGCVTLQPRTLLGLYLEGIWDNFGKSLGGLLEVFGRYGWSLGSLSLVFGGL